MKKLLFFLFAVLMIFVMADNRCMAAEQSLNEKIIDHPDAELIGDDWYRIVIKDNLSNTKFDWRFNLRKIESYRDGIVIGLRKEQNSGSTPNSNFVIAYTFLDVNSDGKLDDWHAERFISIEQEEGIWLRTTPSWPDRFMYKDRLSREEADIIFQKELTFWKYKLK